MRGCRSTRNQRTWWSRSDLGSLPRVEDSRVGADLKATTSKILEIKGLRALAATLVLIFHAKFISGGFIGVDIFYVISGFLITGLLLKELNATGRISLKAFYLRRSKRLLPASFLVLFVTALFAWLVLPPISRGSIGRDLIATTLYISNYLFAWWENDY